MTRKADLHIHTIVSGDVLNIPEVLIHDSEKIKRF